MLDYRPEADMLWLGPEPPLLAKSRLNGHRPGRDRLGTERLRR